MKQLVRAVDWNLASSEPDLFKRMVTLSIILHIAIMFFFAIKATLFPHESLNLDAAIRVDLVGLPEKMQQIPEKPAPIAPLPPAKVIPKIEPAKPKPVVLAPSLKAKTLEKIKKLEREEREKKVLDAIKQEVAQEEAKTERQAKLNQLLKGNAVSSGTALHGLQKSEFNEYLGELQNHVHEHWNLPEWLQNDTLKATVIVYIDFQGNVLKKTVEKSSGDTRFDGYALKAVEDASPFPKPPANFVNLVKVDGITLEFP